MSHEKGFAFMRLAASQGWTQHLIDQANVCTEWWPPKSRFTEEARTIIVNYFDQRFPRRQAR